MTAVKDMTPQELDTESDRLIAQWKREALLEGDQPEAESEGYKDGYERGLKAGYNEATER